MTPQREFGDGTWQVGVDIEAGMYVAEAPDEHGYWERLGDFTGESTLAAGVARDGARLIVEVCPTDAGFVSHGCGRWAKRADPTPVPTSDTHGHAADASEDGLGHGHAADAGDDGLDHRDPVGSGAHVDLGTALDTDGDPDAEADNSGRIYWPDGPPCPWHCNLDLAGLAGDELRRRQRLLARGYFGFGPGLAYAEGFDVPLTTLLDGERLYLLWADVPLLGSPSDSTATRVGIGGLLPPGIVAWLSTPVGDSRSGLAVLGPGDVVITNRRVVAVGAEHAFTWPLDELLRVDWQPLDEPHRRRQREHRGDACLLHVASRQTASGFGVEPGQRATIDFVLQLAMTDLTGEREKLVESLTH